MHKGVFSGNALDTSQGWHSRHCEPFKYIPLWYFVICFVKWQKCPPPTPTHPHPPPPPRKKAGACSLYACYYWRFECVQSETVPLICHRVVMKTWNGTCMKAVSLDGGNFRSASVRLLWPQLLRLSHVSLLWTLLHVHHLQRKLAVYIYMYNTYICNLQRVYAVDGAQVHQAQRPVDNRMSYMYMCLCRCAIFMTTLPSTSAWFYGLGPHPVVK